MAELKLVNLKTLNEKNYGSLLSHCPFSHCFLFHGLKLLWQLSLDSLWIPVPQNPLLSL
jgi:hypothetical protein